MALAALLLGACATGADVMPRGTGGRRDGGGNGSDAQGGGVCDPPCADGEMCSAGTCVPATDVDGDGLEGPHDCDDFDPAIGAMGERECSGPCGTGIETCTDGVWSGCTAPTSCDCEPGAPPRTIPCMRCGLQRQVCSGGRWVDDGPCTGAGPCSPGEVGTGGACGNCGTERRTCGMDCTWGPWACEGEGVCAPGTVDEQMQACGACGTGTQARTRTCATDCTWGPWDAWGTCVGGGAGACMPGQTQTETQACGACGLGTQTRTRTCDASSCDWGPWSAWSSCSGGGACTPGSTRACANGDPCGHEVCTSSCTWGACEPRTPGGCLRIRPGTSGPPGNNYRCCPLGGGDLGWQFCLPSCVWSTDCEATTAC